MRHRSAVTSENDINVEEDSLMLDKADYEILGLLTEGKSNREVSEELKIPLSTPA